jgi:hypothetical protein
MRCKRAVRGGADLPGFRSARSSNDLVGIPLHGFYFFRREICGLGMVCAMSSF